MNNSIFRIVSQLFLARGFVFELLLCLLGVLFLGGLYGYVGSKFVYILFSISFLLLLWDGVSHALTYGYTFLAIMLFLGFWLKLTIHSIFKQSYIEPIGYFVESASALDEVLWVAIVASLGVLMARVVYGLVASSTYLAINNRQNKFSVPKWYIPVRKWIWLGLIQTSLTLGIVNAVYGIQLGGIVAKTILLWPLNAVIALSLSIGLAIALSTMLWWDALLRKDVFSVSYIMLVVSFISSVSLLSRAVFIFSVIPMLLVLFVNREEIIGYVGKKISLLILVSVFLMVI